ncbi:hypothetical protein D3C86_1162750 [compost metagenome]
MDLFGGGASALCKGAHFVGNHGKTATLLTGPGRLDRRIERQQVGLFGNGRDDIHDTADRLRFARQCVDRLADFVDRFMHGFHGVQALPGQFTALARQLVGLRRGMRGADDVLGNFLDGGGHL